MGATCWSYVVPYAGDVERALRELQARVFADRAYYDRRRSLADSIPRLTEIMQGLPPADLEKMIAEVKAKIAAPDPATIAELLAMNEDSGTHSILDMQGVSTKARAFRVAPLTDSQLKKVFGKTRPARTDVEPALSSIWELRQRWQGTYVLLYDNKGAPTELLFTGCSGD